MLRLVVSKSVRSVAICYDVCHISIMFSDEH